MYQTITHIASYEGNCWQQEGVSAAKYSADTLELTGVKKQKILGFGGCFNELGWEALQLADEKERENFLEELFAADKCNFNFGRVPIGANDFSLEWYSCDEVDGDYALEHFNIERDKKYTIPFIREAQKWQKDFAVFASPWSPPTWMKTKKVCNFGNMRMEEEVLKAYAQYFIKFVKAYEKEGVPVAQIHVQNEPVSDQKFPSCVWTGEELRVFIREYMGPALKEAGLDTQLWLGTINTTAMDYANTVLADEAARSFLSGVGLQWAGKYAIEQVEESYPELHLMQTESECGDGRNLWSYMEYIFSLMRIYFNHGAERYIYWNIALQDGGISTWGWCQNSLCTVNPKTRELKYQPEFYLMKHLSHFVKEGADLLSVKGHWTANSLAFENPDGSIVLVVNNNLDYDRQFAFVHGEKSFNAELKAHSLHTFVVK